MTINFYDAKTIVLLNDETIILSITGDDVLSMDNPKYSTVGLGHFLFEVQPLKVSFRLNAISDILDNDSVPIPMDSNNILNKYMFVILYNSTLKFSYFILYSTGDIDYLNNIATFNCIPMIGVILLYGNSNVVRTDDDGILYKVPRNISMEYNDNKDAPLQIRTIWTYGNYSNLIRLVIQTTIVNIFSNNNLNDEYSYLWGSYAPKTTLINFQPTLPYLNIEDTDYNYTPGVFSYIVALINFKSWNTYINEFITKYGIPNYLVENLIMNLDKISDVNSAGKRQVYGERQCIDFLPDPEGYTFNELIELLTLANAFKYETGTLPYMLPDDTTTDPGNIATGQTVIGTSRYTPMWLPDTNPYMYHLVENDNVKRSLNILYWKHIYIIYYLNPNMGAGRRARSLYRKSRMKLDIITPLTAGTFVDTGWVQHGPTNVVNNNDYDDFIKDNIYFELDSDVLSDDFINYYTDSTEDYTKWYYLSKYNSDLTRKIELNRLKANVEYNIPSIVQKILLNTTTTLLYKDGVSSIDLIKQLMILLHFSFCINVLIINGQLYLNHKHVQYTNAFKFQSLADVTGTMIITLSEVQSYKILPIIKELPSDPYKYDVVEKNDTYSLIIKSLNNTIMNLYNTKITMEIIGIRFDINMTTNRFIIFKNFILSITSIQYSESTNTTIIEAYGRKIN